MILMEDMMYQLLYVKYENGVLFFKGLILPSMLFIIQMMTCLKILKWFG